MDDVLMCPICGREMDTILVIPSRCETMSGFDYSCSTGHERVLVKFRHEMTAIFIHLGGGCYIVDSIDNTSCEKAIARMRKEYEWETGFTNGV